MRLKIEFRTSTGSSTTTHGFITLVKTTPTVITTVAVPISKIIYVISPVLSLIPVSVTRTSTSKSTHHIATVLFTKITHVSALTPTRINIVIFS